MLSRKDSKTFNALFFCISISFDAIRFWLVIDYSDLLKSGNITDTIRHQDILPLSLKFISARLQKAGKCLHQKPYLVPFRMISIRLLLLIYRVYRYFKQFGFNANGVDKTKAMSSSGQWQKRKRFLIDVSYAIQTIINAA